MELHSPKKSLGQNFFINENLAKWIVEKVTALNPDIVLEIGPGTGVFTHLISKSKPILAIEKDTFLANMLKSHFLDNKNVKIIENDIFNFEFHDLIEFLDKKTFIVYGSLPYNQSKRIIEHLLTKIPADNYYFIIQKEVAEKYISNKNNIIKIKSEIFSEAKILKIIKPSNFKPIPKVTSTLISFSPIEKPLLKITKYDKFCKFIIMCFRFPRKTLYNNLLGSNYKISKEHQYATLRPSEISTKTFIEIFDEYTQ